MYIFAMYVGYESYKNVESGRCPLSTKVADVSRVICGQNDLLTPFS